MPSDPGQSGLLTLLFTCVGRRIELLQSFRAAAKRLGYKLRIVAVDNDVTAPGLICADEPVVVPPAKDPQYLPTLLETVARYQADALIPTTDTDLPVISAHRAEFDAAGCIALIADLDVIRICRNKLKTYRFLHENGIDTPASYTVEEILSRSQLDFPLFSKPLSGSAGQRVNRINDRLDLEYFTKRYDDLIIQEFVDGQEYTLDAYVGLNGQTRCVVPRARWQVRTGEVCKGVVVKDPRIMAAGRRVVDALGNSPRGVVTLQCILTPDQRIRFIEINPRFGGGAPMAIAAGADFPAWLLQELRGEIAPVTFDGFRHGLCMLRFDWSAFLPLDDDLTPKITKPLHPFPPFE
ncbi:MAG: ATP-grasp domain-containing protein [Planctomycetota bacterium]